MNTFLKLKKHYFKASSSRKLLLPLFLMCLIIPFVAINSNKEEKIKRIFILQEGLGICFNRILQTYTGKLIKSPEMTPLSKDFTNLTEECFGDAINEFDHIFKNSRPEILNKEINKLTTHVFWFHKKIHKNTLPIAELTNTFQKLEESKSSSMDRLEKIRKKLYVESKILNQIIFIALIAMTLLLFISYIKFRARDITSENYEIDAKEELGRKQLPSLLRLEEIIKGVLEHHNLNYSLALLKKFQNELLDNALMGKKISSEELNNLRPTPPRTSLPSKFERVRLSDLFSDIVREHSKKLFSRGIVVHLNIDDQLCIKTQKKAFHETLFNLMLGPINSINKNQKNKKIIITAQQKFKKIYITVVDTAINASYKAYDFQFKDLEESFKNLGGSIVFEEKDNNMQGTQNKKIEIEFPAYLESEIYQGEKFFEI